ncbi:hypothetical protein EGI22_12235 [Lacihabitans sp. LS3-19]|uniref:DUF6364 family protein n=1 Tax=Lacihabitans sp. LS3-19 TaxID=2487335 RepID=UPI0020CCB8DB|nr:DUF6364 family protein [Lacihabitans sp. LS3-19]MCP9768686.1 hypothetical protein [Lacihabitans sp. LS3-19]
MDTKLTLVADKEIIEKAKQYAKSQKLSLSRLVESYLSSLVSPKSEESEISPLVKSLSGVIKLENDFDAKEGYTDFLLEKYK